MTKNLQKNKYKYINQIEHQFSEQQLRKSKNINHFNLINKEQFITLQRRSLSKSINKQKIPEQQQDIKNRKIKKLTNINKHLIEILKQKNQQLTKRVQKQKFKVPNKGQIKKNQNNPVKTKQLQALKRQLQNAYKIMDFHQGTLNNLRTTYIPIDNQEKFNDLLNKLRQKTELLENLQSQINTYKQIKKKQDKQLGKFQNQEFKGSLKKIDKQILELKDKLKEAKKNFSKRQELQKKQHMYLAEIELLMKKVQKQEQNQEVKQNIKHSEQEQQKLTEVEWKRLKRELAQERKKYQDNGKKFSYLNYLKSKQGKSYEQTELILKQKIKNLQKLKSKQTQVEKLIRLKPKPQILERVNLKMEKLKDIISRHDTIEISKGGIKRNVIQYRSNTQDVRQFKRWQIQNIELLKNSRIKQNENVQDQNDQI